MDDDNFEKRNITNPIEKKESIPDENDFSDLLENTADGEIAVEEKDIIPDEKIPTVNDKKSKESATKKLIAIIVATAVVCALIGGVIGGLIVKKTMPKNDDTSVTTTAPEKNTKTPNEVVSYEDIKTTKPSTTAAANNNAVETTVPVTAATSIKPSEIYKKNLPSCVGIEIATGNSKIMGSGFIITSDGYIVTNNHVVEGFDKCTVIKWDNTKYTGKVIGTDEANDIAVVKIDETNLSPITFGSSNNLSIGDPIYVIGNPLGELTFSMTSGIVSAVNRTVMVENGMTINMFQTDAAINSGNSGGAVFDENGKVVGIAAAKLSGNGFTSASVEGLCFCIPIDDVKQMLEELRITGYVTGRAFLGVEVTDQIVQSRLIFSTVQQINGAMIVAIKPSSAATLTGLKVNDIIIEMNGTTISSVATLKAEMSKLKAGGTAKMIVYRAGQEVSVDVAFEEYTPEKAVSTVSGSTVL